MRVRQKFQYRFMSDATIWLAFKGVSRTAILDRWKLQRATEPDPAIFGTDLPDMWYLVLGNGLRFMDDSIMNEACFDCHAVSCYLESHVMVSAAAGWERGRRVWSVLHDSEQDRNHLQAEGELPAAYAAIRETLSAKQKDQGERPRVDYIFDVPIDLAAAVTWFHHDRGTTAGYPGFESLEMAVVPSMPVEWWLQSSRPESWFTRYFG